MVIGRASQMMALSLTPWNVSGPVSWIFKQDYDIIHLRAWDITTLMATGTNCKRGCRRGYRGKILFIVAFIKHLETGIEK